MSKFNRCKDCGSTSPESGWVGTSNSLCAACAKTRPRRRFEARVAAEEMADAINPIPRNKRLQMAMLAALAGGFRR